MRGAIFLVCALATACVSSIREQETRTKESTEILKVRPNADHRLTWVLREDTRVTTKVEVERESTMSEPKGKVLSTSVLSTETLGRQQLWLCYRDERFARPQCYPAKWHSKEPPPERRPLPFHTLPPGDEQPPPPEGFIEPDESDTGDATP